MNEGEVLALMSPLEEICSVCFRSYSVYPWPYHSQCDSTLPAVFCEDPAAMFERNGSQVFQINQHIGTA